MSIGSVNIRGLTFLKLLLLLELELDACNVDDLLLLLLLLSDDLGWCEAVAAPRARPAAANSLPVDLGKRLLLMYDIKFQFNSRLNSLRVLAKSPNNKANEKKLFALLFSPRFHCCTVSVAKKAVNYGMKLKKLEINAQ